jgi:DNA polymerase-2
VVELAGRLESGASFLVRDDRERPYFYVAAADASRVADTGRARVSPSSHRSMDGTPVARVEVSVPGEVPPLRDRLTKMGIGCYEADVRFATRYLIARGVRGALEILGSWRSRPGIDRVYANPVVAPGSWSPELRVLALDVETDPEASRLLSVALHGCGASEVLLLSPSAGRAPRGVLPAGSERELVVALSRRVAELDPDVITGWNVIDFDLTVLARAAGRLGVPLALGRGPEPLRLRPARGGRRSREAFVTGRVLLDGIDLLRGAFVKLEEYSLETAARAVLGEGKTLAGPDKARQILELYRSDPERFAEYNRTDARLALEILERLRLLPLAVERSRLTGMTLDRVGGAIASFDFLYLSELGRRRIVAPSVRAAAPGEESFGGHVLEPVPGLHRNVLAFDFRSLYPSVIRTFQVDPLGLLPPDHGERDAIVAPNGTAFRRGPGILPKLLDELVPTREAAIARGDRITSHAIKILMNSFYGVLGTPACRFYDPAVAGAITALGREILLWSRDWFLRRELQVLYGDTDSLFVASDRSVPENALAQGAELAAQLNGDLSEWLRERWEVESHLELRFERLFLRLLLPATRQGGAGARKRYAGLVADEVVLVGLEAVRSDWTPLAREVQRELYARLFRDEPVEDYLRGVVGELRCGARDQQLVYTKTLRKPLDDYTATTPPHVAAARKGGVAPGRRVRYLVTRSGPEPAEAAASPIDHEHYVQKQVRPVAEPVLNVLGLDFDRVVGDPTQLSLF